MDLVRSPLAGNLLLNAAVNVAVLPARLAIAATRATLALGSLASPVGPIRRPGGYADLLLRVIGENGYAEQLTELLRDEEGPMRLAATINELTAPDRPLGRLLARDGTLDRLLDERGPLMRLLSSKGALDRLFARNGPFERLLAADGALDRLLAEGGALDQLVVKEGVLDRLLAAGGALDRVTAADGVLDRVLAPGGLADRILTEDGFVEKLVAQGGTLDQLVSLGETLESIRPRLTALADVVPELARSAESLGRAVGPIGDLAGRLPISRRRQLNGPS